VQCQYARLWRGGLGNSLGAGGIACLDRRSDSWLFVVADQVGSGALTIEVIDKAKILVNYASSFLGKNLDAKGYIIIKLGSEVPDKEI
jgi:hypothetical protein